MLGLNEEGQVERKDGSFALCALCRNGVGLIAHTSHQGQRDRETKACSFKDTSRAGIGLVERLEDVLLDIITHTDSCVDDLEL